MNRPALIIHVPPARAEWWRATLQELLPELDCRSWDAAGDPAAIEYAAVWRPPAGGLRWFSNLRAICSIGAGVDHVFADPQLPPGVPILRISGPELSQRMAEYVALQVLRYHRRMPALEERQARAAWEAVITPLASARTVGLMGLGSMGRAAARALLALGFRVCAWTRSARTVEAIENFHGRDGLPVFLACTDILVCLLPLTAETSGILNRENFATLPRGAYLINAGRGEHLIDDDLIAALDSGQLAGATLDVFRTEPLPAEHRFWRHPKITVTPHVASLIDPLTGGRLVAEAIRAFRAGQPTGVVDPARGY